jgi:hypothetical protein
MKDFMTIPAPSIVLPLWYLKVILMIKVIISWVSLGCSNKARGENLSGRFVARLPHPCGVLGWHLGRIWTPLTLKIYSGVVWSTPSSIISSIRPLLTVDPNQNPKTYLWIGFGHQTGWCKNNAISFWEILNVVNHLLWHRMTKPL